MKSLWKIGLVFGLLWSSMAVAETFEATVNRTEVPQGETFLLTLETDDDKTNATPDLSVLDKDFTVYSVGNAFQSSYVNGVTTHSRQWQIVLMPKNAGQIEVPAIKFGKLSSTPVQLNVTPARLVKQPSGTPDTEAPKFAVEAEVDNQNPFVQQQITYTFKLYDSGGLHGDMPMVLDNGNSDWIVKSLGQPKINSRIINGRQLREIEFKYALFPQKSGILQTPDMEFSGYYLTRGRRGGDAFDDVFNSGFFKIGFSDMFATRQPVVLKPEAIKIEVKPVPGANGGYWWLPASQVVLTSEWDDKKPVFRVGEATGRSVYLKAAGVIENQLPDIKFAEIDGVKQYPEKPVAMSTQTKDDIISIKKFSNVFIPEKAGKMVIPEISIDWYNIHDGQIEKAVLPAQTVNVLPAISEPTADETKTSSPQTEEQPIVTLPEPKIEKSMPLKDNKIPFELWIGVAFVSGIILSWFLFGRNKEKRLTAKDYAKNVEKAALSGDMKQLRDNLLEWARQMFSDVKINNLDDVAKHGSQMFRKQLQNIDKMLYSSKKSEFSAAEFIKLFKEEQKKQNFTSSRPPLPNLYK